MRIRCVLWGCWCDQNSSCPKCGAALYDADYIQIGKLEWIRKVVGFFRGIYRFANRRCEVCGKKIRFNRHDDYTCSDECFDKWLPF